jgi:hypothetical protein
MTGVRIFRLEKSDPRAGHHWYRDRKQEHFILFASLLVILNVNE